MFRPRCIRFIQILQNQQTRVLWDTDKQKYQFLLIFPVFSCYIGGILLNFFEDNAKLRGRRRARLAAKVPSWNLLLGISAVSAACNHSDHHGAKTHGFWVISRIYGPPGRGLMSGWRIFVFHGVHLEFACAELCRIVN